MGTLYDSSGKPVDVPDAQLTQALLSGQYKTDKPQVSVRAGGKVFSVPTENLGTFAQAQPDLKIMSDAETAAHDKEKADAANQEKYGGLGSQAKVAGVSALGGATLGLSDVLLGGVLSHEQKDTLAHERAANPYTDLGAGVVGALAPTLLTGGAAAPEEMAVLGGREALGAVDAGAELAKAGSGASKLSRILGGARDVVTAPTRALEAASGLAERGAAKVVGTEADSFLGQLAQKAVIKAAGGATTGALATGAMEVGENEISADHNLTGEQLLQHMGMGALLGGGLGAAGGLASKTLERALSPSAEAAAAGGEGTIREAIEKKAAELQFGATGAKTPEIKKLAASGLKPHEAGRWMLDNLAKYTEDGTAPATREGIIEASQRAMDEATPRIGGKIDALDQLGAKVDGQAVIERLRRELIEPLDKKLGMESVTARLNQIVDKSQARLEQNNSFRELFDLRKEIDDLAFRDKRVMDQSNAMQELRNARRTIEDEIGKQGEAFAGPDWKAGYDADKSQYRMAASVNDAATSADKRISGNHGISLTDTIMASHGLGALAMGHPLGLVTGLAGGVANHLLKAYGDAAGSRILDRIVKSGALGSTVIPAAAQRSVIAAQRSYQTAVVRGVAALTRGETASREPGRPRTVDGDFERKSAQIQNMLQDPKAHAQQIDAHAQAMGPSFATTASSYQRAAMGSSVYLAQQMPRSKPIDPMSPKAGTIEPTTLEKDRFNRVFDAVHEPTGILHSAADGTLTRDVIDAVANTHPATLADLQKRITAEMKNLKEPLSPAQQASVKMLLGVPVFDHPPQPQNPQPMPQGQPKQAKKTGSKPLKLNVSSTTGLVGSRVS